MRLRWWGTLALVLGCSSGPASTAGELRDALASANDGDVVEIGAGRFEGTFRVPAGVRVQGEGAQTTLASSGSVALFVDTAPGMATSVRGLHIESAGTAGIAVYGGGAASLRDMNVAYTRSVGVAAEDVAELTMERVTIEGTVTSDNAETLPNDADSGNSSSHGLILIRVEDARLTDVVSRGATNFGALFVSSVVEWETGGVEENLGTGLMVAGGDVRIVGADIATTLQGFRLLPVYGGVVAAGANVETSGVQIRDNEGVGLVCTQATTRHQDLIGRGNRDASLWIQESAGVSVVGDSRFIDNMFASIVAIDALDLNIDGASIASTESAVRSIGLVGRVEVGDGLQIVRPANAALSNLELEENMRAGLLVDLGATGSTDEISLSNVSASGSDDALGVVAQRGSVVDGWDTEVMRRGVVASNDAAFFATGNLLDALEVVTPTDLPRVDDIADSGLELFGVVTPTD